MNAIKIGISSCLLGHKVRHDGGHKRNAYAVNTLAKYFEFKPFCPEIAIGLGVPRPTLRLVKADAEVRLVGVRDPRLDVTGDMLQGADQVIQQLDDLSGYILKKDSPSCGMERVRVYNGKGQPERNGRGLFASKLLEARPNLPVEEEGRLMDPVLRENFIERVFVFYRWQQVLREDLTVRGLMDFHSQHKFNLLAHSENAYRELGPLVASASPENLDASSERYIEKLMQALRQLATRKRHTNVLMHVMGYLKKVLTSDEKQELREILDNYRHGQVPLIVPITLLRHHLRRAPDPYIEKQYYLDPYPEELMLRNNL